MNNHSEEEIRSKAQSALAYIYKGIKHHNTVQKLSQTYLSFCESSEAKQLGIKYKHINNEVKTRLLFELICLAAFYTSLIAPKYFPTQEIFRKELPYEPIRYFNNQVGKYLVEMCNKEGMTDLKEITVISIEPEIDFGLGEVLNPLNRLIEYAKCSAEQPGTEAEHFGKYIGKSLDPYHYPILELLGGFEAKGLLTIADSAMKGVFD